MKITTYSNVPKERAFTPKRRQTGTTLVEILVVIVIFLIGILAVVQIFPRGFRILLGTRNNSVATALGRDTVERLKANPELIPDEIVAVRYSGGVPEVDTSLNPLALGPVGDALSANGALLNGGDLVASDWNLASGPNRARRIVGEGHPIPTPRQVGELMGGAARYENYGGLLVLDQGPIDPGRNQTAPNVNIVAYGNEMNRTFGLPREAALVAAFATRSATGDPVQRMSPDGSTVQGNVTAASTVGTPVTLAPYEGYVVDANSSRAYVLLPTSRVDRTYRIRMSAYLAGGGKIQRFDYISLSVRVPRLPIAALGTDPLVRIPLVELLAGTDEMNAGYSFQSVEADSVRIAPQYVRVASWASLDSIGAVPGNYAPIDPFQMKVADRNLGVLIFSPAAREGIVSRPGGAEEPLVARVDYDVLDWRIIKEDFRAIGNSVTFPLALQSLKVGNNRGPDGLNNGGLFTGDRSQATDGNSYDPVPSPRDNVVVIDLATGFEVQKYRTDAAGPNGRTMADVTSGAVANADILFTVDKSRGSVTLLDADPGTNGIQVRLIPPVGGGAPFLVNSDNRSFRVLYRAREEWAVQVLKGASQYSLVNSLQAPLAPDQALVGGVTDGRPTRIYFPKGEVGHKVTIDRIAYRDSNGEHLLEGQDFVIRPATASDVPDLPYADITEVLGKGDLNLQFSYAYGLPVRGIKGASLSVRVLWNPESFSLTGDAATNIARVDEWGRGWRKSVTETYLRAEETR